MQLVDSITYSSYQSVIFNENLMLVIISFVERKGDRVEKRENATGTQAQFTSTK